MLLINFRSPFFWCTGAVILIVMMLGAVPDAFVGHLAYRRSFVLEGQWWRLYSGNWVHFGWYHTAMNVLGLGLVGITLFARKNEVAWLLGLLLIPSVVGLSLFLYYPNVEEYRGFSAAIYGLLALGLILEWRHNPWVNSAALVFLFGKIVAEQMPDYDVDYLKEQIGVAVAIEAHLWGVAAGVSLALMIELKRYYLKRQGRQTSTNLESLE